MDGYRRSGERVHDHATYDGTPDHPEPDRLWEVVENLGVTALGVSPTLIRSLQPYGAEMARRHDLSRLRVFGSTGEPWNPEPWWWLFRDVGGERVPVNIFGGDGDRSLSPLGQPPSRAETDFPGRTRASGWTPMSSTRPESRCEGRWASWW